MSSTVRLSAADARVLRGLIKAFHLEEHLFAFEKQARPSPGEMELSLELYLAVRDALFQAKPEFIEEQLSREGIHVRDIPSVLIRLGLPVVGRTLNPAGHSVSSSTDDNRSWFRYVYTSAGTYEQALEAFRTAFFPSFSDEEWDVWRSRVRIRIGRLTPPDPDD